MAYALDSLSVYAIAVWQFFMPTRVWSILDYERGAWSWSRFLGSQPAGELVMNPVVGCHYFPPVLW